MPTDGQVARRGQGHPHDRTLRGRVGQLSDLAVEGGHRGGVDDHAPLAVVERLGLTAMADAALVMTLNVPTTLRSWMNLNALRSCGELSRLMTRPTHPVPAQFTAMRSARPRRPGRRRAGSRRGR